MLTESPTTRGVLQSQIDGYDGAAVVCVVPGEPVALTLGDKLHVVTVQFDSAAAITLSDILREAAEHADELIP